MKTNRYQSSMLSTAELRQFLAQHENPTSWTSALILRGVQAELADRPKEQTAIRKNEMAMGKY